MKQRSLLRIFLVCLLVIFYLIRFFFYSDNSKSCKTQSQLLQIFRCNDMYKASCLHACSSKERKASFTILTVQCLRTRSTKHKYLRFVVSSEMELKKCEDTAAVFSLFEFQYNQTQFSVCRMNIGTHIDFSEISFSGKWSSNHSIAIFDVCADVHPAWTQTRWKYQEILQERFSEAFRRIFLWLP